MASKSYFEDNRLDIVILGPMNKKKVDSSLGIIRDAIKQILYEPRSRQLLNDTRTIAWDVHIPEEWNEQEIINGILSRLDIADLVIINLTPKDGPAGSSSPNVYYELGLLHALGLPVMAIFQSGSTIPFYVGTLKFYEVPEFDVALLANELRTPIQKFLNKDDTTDFTDNRVTQFYDHLPIVDISAAVGLATGYYYNFVGRLLRDGSFVTAYPDKVKQLIIVRPSNVLNTYEQDMEKLRTVLSGAGFVLGAGEKLDEPPGDRKGPAWIFHIDGIVIDLPRMIYPLKISPRLMTMQERFDKPGPYSYSVPQRNLYLLQTSERLLDRVERVILYHVNKRGEGYRKSLLHFARIEEVPALLLKLGLQPNK